MKYIVSTVILIVVLITACTPSQEEIQATVQASIAETQKAMPTETLLPTETPMPTATATATETATVTPSPSPTPDVRVIDIDPRKILLDKEDLPVQGKYFLPGPGWISRSTNAEVIAVRTVEEGQQYISETGRILGWYVYYKRGTNSAVLPQEISGGSYLFASTEGAQLAVTKFSILTDDFAEIDAPKIGDISRVSIKKVTNSGGNTQVNLEVEFTYRNIYCFVNGWGWENEVTLDVVMNIAEKLLEGLKQLPLSDTVTFSP